jgi:hypothetical protein
MNLVFSLICVIEWVGLFMELDCIVKT